MDPRSGGAAPAGVAATVRKLPRYLCSCNFTQLKQLFFDFLQIQRPWMGHRLKQLWSLCQSDCTQCLMSPRAQPSSEADSQQLGANILGTKPRILT